MVLWLSMVGTSCIQTKKYFKTILILNSRTSKQAKPQGKESMLQHYLNITVHRNENSMVEASPTINEANYTSDSQSDSIVV